MSQREAKLMWLRDMLEHLSARRQRLEWTRDREAARALTEAMLRDLEQCHRLCLALQPRGAELAA